MAELGPRLSAALVRFEVVDPGDPAAQFCLGEYFAELDRRFDAGFDPALSITGLHELRPPAGAFLVATLHEEPLACGGVVFGEAAYLKRMWVSRSARGIGLGRRLLEELEGQAAASGARAVTLETNKSLTEAISLYRSAGYREVDAFNDEPYAHHWFEKRLDR